MKNSNKSNKILIFILLVLVIVAGIVIGKEILQNKEQKIENTIQTTNTSTANQENPAITNKTEEQNQTSQTSHLEDNELFAEYYEQAEKLMENMTIEEKVGQMFLARYPENNVIQEIKEQNPGGYILFGRDFEKETKDSILKELTQCQDASKIKLALGVDEEGGTVVRVSNNKAFRNTKFLSPQQIWAQGQLGAILKDSTEKSTLLKSIGLNMNLTPVADVPTKTTSFMYNRSYGRGAEKTAIYVEELIKTMNQDGMISTMKHFPGYGDNVDTQTGIAIDERP